MIPRHRLRVGFDTHRSVIAGLAAMILVVLIPVSSWSKNPFPAKINGIKLGQSMSSVIDMVKGSGRYETKLGTETRRPSLVWFLPNNPYYKKVSFKFTEKDRLYLIHFDLKNISRRDSRELKESLFDKYGISWDNPWRLKAKGQDVLLYGPPNLGRIYYFEFSDPKTGERAYELLERVVSSEDRPSKKTSKKTEKTKTGAGTQGVVTKEDAGHRQDSQATGAGKGTGEQPAKPLPKKKIEPDTKESSE